MEKRGLENVSGQSRGAGYCQIAWGSPISTQSLPLYSLDAKLLTFSTQFPPFPLSFPEGVIPREMAAKERFSSVN